jgi:hypothetical protein
MQIIVGLIMVALGFSMVYFANWMYNNIGAVSFFEKYLGGGGTRLGYKLIGMFVIFLGALSTFGLIDVFLLWVFDPIIKLMMPKS